MSTPKPPLITNNSNLPPKSEDTLTLTPAEETLGGPLKEVRYKIIEGDNLNTVIDTWTGSKNNTGLRHVELDEIPSSINYKEYIKFANELYEDAPKAPGTLTAFYSALKACKDVGYLILSRPFPYSINDKKVVIKDIDAIVRALVKFMRYKSIKHKQDIFNVMAELLYLRQSATGPVEGNDGRVGDLKKIQKQLYDRQIGTRNNTHSNHKGGRRRRTQKRKN